MKASDIFSTAIINEGDKLVLICFAFDKIMAQVKARLDVLQKVAGEWSAGTIVDDGRGFDAAVWIRARTWEEKLSKG
jgi:hypothetical protein